MAGFAAMRNLDVWYARMEVEELLQRYQTQLKADVVKRVRTQAEAAKSRDSLTAFSKLTRVADGEIRFVSKPPLVVPIDEIIPDQIVRDDLEIRMRRIIATYRRTLQQDRRHLLEQFRFVDLARKVVGVGSVGTRAWIVLMLGRDADDPLILQVKEAQASVLDRRASKPLFTNHGQRVVQGQRMIQQASDIFLGWERVEGIDLERRDFYIRQLRDWKLSAAIETMVPSTMQVYARMCGWTLARAHARSGDRIAIASYLGKSDAFDRAMVTFSERYADQNERDHEALAKAIRKGRIVAETGI